MDVKPNTQMCCFFVSFEPKFDGGLLKEHFRALETSFRGENKPIWVETPKGKALLGKKKIRFCS